MKHTIQELRQYIQDRIKVDPKTGCWEWKQSRHRMGYGYAWCANKSIRAHRLSYLVHIGPIPKGACVLHRCDNPPCCNPDHLWAGTQAENLADMATKGRSAKMRGDSCGMAKLDAADVRAIRALLADGALLHREIAVQFGVSRTTISSIKTGKRWSYNQHRYED